MPITWPSSSYLPQALLEDGYNESLPNNTIIADPDVGPAIMRRRSTAAATPFSGQMNLTKAQWGYLTTFYNTTTAGGSVEFTWVHPTLGTSAQIIFLAPPRIVGIKADYYLVALSMAVLP